MKIQNIFVIVVIAFCSAFCSGCGTLISGQPSKNVYGGIGTDCKWIGEKGGGSAGRIVAIIDVPFSLTADTLFLPWDLYFIVKTYPSDLVKGWTCYNANLQPPNRHDPGEPYYQIDKAIIDDYTAYAHSVWPKGHDFFISEVDYYEDGTGQHAVRIELETGLRRYREYYLFYDKNNVRTKVMRSPSGSQSQFSM
jgi:uncharacterized protein YceK